MSDNSKVLCVDRPATSSDVTVAIPERLLKELIYEIPKAKNALFAAAHPYPSPYQKDLERLVAELEAALEQGK
jgi:hypothetical protein